MRKGLKRVAAAGLVIAGCLLLLEYVLPRPITLRKAERKAYFDYAGHKEAFARLADATDLSGDLLNALLSIPPVRKQRVPDELASLGIGSVFVSDGMLFCEYAEGIMGITAFGILFSEDVSALEEWYRTKPIENGWHYYRVVS